MTRYLGPDGKVHIRWDGEGEPVDWTTPNVGDGINHEFCGNCGWDSPGCGCPRDPHYDGTDPRALPVQLTQAICHAAMAAERQRVFTRIHERAAEGDPDMVYLAKVFTSPEQLLGGSEEAPDG